MNPSSLIRASAISLALLFCMAAQAHAAGKSQSIATDGTASITVNSWMEHVPLTGLMPITVKVRNDATSPRSWTLRSVDEDYTTGQMQGEFHFSAPANGESTTHFLVPVMPDYSNARGYANLRIMVDGPGVQSMGMFILTASSASTSSTKTVLTPFLGIGQKFEDRDGVAWKLACFGSRTFLGDVVQMSDAPEDWRGYSALAQLWITDDEWTGLSSIQRTALLGWVAQGGDVVVSAKAGVSSLPMPEGFAPWSGTELNLGMGRINLLAGEQALKSGSESLIQLAKQIAVSRLADSQPSEKGRLAGLIPALTMNTWLVFSFILIFGIVVGPLNLFWFAAGNRRPRMFWTTPLISFIGATVLMVVMILQDGFGGTGARASLAVLVPEQKQMAIVQEQFAKTGILLGSQFELPKGGTAWLSQVPTTRELKTGYGTTTVQTEKRSLGLTESSATGGWFTSRAIQSMLVHESRMNRGGIEFLPGASPGVINSLTTPLKTVFIQDDQQHYWMAENVRIGERVTLKQSTRQAFKNWLEKDAQSRMGDLLRLRMRQVTPDTNSWFFAEVSEPSKLATPTLTTIHWQHDRAFVAGRYEKSETTK